MPKTAKILDLKPVSIKGQQGVIMIGEQSVERAARLYSFDERAYRRLEKKGFNFEV